MILLDSVGLGNNYKKVTHISNPHGVVVGKLQKNAEDKVKRGEKTWYKKCFCRSRNRTRWGPLVC